MKTFNAFKLCTLILTCTILFVSCSIEQYTVKDFPDSPCFNERFIQLENDSTKTESELNEYLALKKMCEDQKNSIAEQNETRKISANIGALLLLNVVIVVVAGIGLIGSN